MTPRLYIEEYECLTSEKNSFFNYLQKYGYKFNEIGNLKDYDRTRSWYNYIQVLISDFNYDSISNEEFDRLKTIFNKGIRFWHYDRIDNLLEVLYFIDLYKYENYERNLLTFSNVPVPEEVIEEQENI